MKISNLKLILCFLFIFSLMASPFKGQGRVNKRYFSIYQIDKRADISSLKGKKYYLKDLKAKKRIRMTRNERDSLLKNYIPTYFGKMDDLERDLFIRSAYHFPKQAFLKKYRKMIDEKNYIKLKKTISEKYL